MTSSSQLIDCCHNLQTKMAHKLSYITPYSIIICSITNLPSHTWCIFTHNILHQLYLHVIDISILCTFHSSTIKDNVSTFRVSIIIFIYSHYCILYAWFKCNTGVYHHMLVIWSHILQLESPCPLKVGIRGQEGEGHRGPRFIHLPIHLSTVTQQGDIGRRGGLH